MNQQYTHRLKKIEEELIKVLPKKVNKQWLDLSTGVKGTHITTESAEKIITPCHELIYRGGKRWRPLIMLLISESLNRGCDLTLNLTPLVELIHNGTLLIDDIEDKAVERRGKPAVHLIYGEDMAINSGNFLYFIPTYIIDGLEIDTDKKLEIYKSYSSNMRRLHYGQGLDIQWHNEINKIPSIEEYIQMCKFKTGCLASMAGELAAISSDMDKKEIEEFRTIWEEIGVGFQIMDDIKNITTGNPGKHRGDDIVEGKKSLPVIIYCNNNDNKELLGFIEKAKQLGIERGYEYVERAISILESDDSILKSRNIANDLIYKNLERLNSFLPINEPKELLIDLIKGFLKN